VGCAFATHHLSKERKHFFFEKKKQKTFICLVAVAQFEPFAAATKSGLN
jgi:hypothetical protein